MTNPSAVAQLRELCIRATKLDSIATGERDRLEARIRANARESTYLYDRVTAFRKYVEEKTLGKPGQRLPKALYDVLIASGAFATGATAGAAAGGAVIAARVAGYTSQVDVFKGDEKWTKENTRIAGVLRDEIEAAQRAASGAKDNAITALKTATQASAATSASAAAWPTVQAELESAVENLEELMGISKEFLGFWSPLKFLEFGTTNANVWVEQQLL